MIPRSFGCPLSAAELIETHQQIAETEDRGSFLEALTQSAGSRGGVYSDELTLKGVLELKALKQGF